MKKSVLTLLLLFTACLSFAKLPSVDELLSIRRLGDKNEMSSYLKRIGSYQYLKDVDVESLRDEGSFSLFGYQCNNAWGHLTASAYLYKGSKNGIVVLRASQYDILAYAMTLDKYVTSKESILNTEQDYTEEVKYKGYNIGLFFGYSKGDFFILIL